MRIRILDVAPQKVDVLIDDGATQAVENHKLLPRKILAAYLDDWLAGFCFARACRKKRASRRCCVRLRDYRAPQALWRNITEFAISCALADYPRCGALFFRRCGLGSVAVKNKKSATGQFLLLANPEGAPDLAAVVAAEKNTLNEIFSRQGSAKTLGKLASSAQILEEIVHRDYVHYSGYVRGRLR